MADNIQQHADKLREKTLKFLNEPWLLAQKPFHIAGGVYHVGTIWVSCYLLDTPDGLALFDCTMQETFYQVIDNIYQLGFDPHNIKKLFLTHAHLDHCGAARALKELSGCEIWLGTDDAFFLTERRDLIGLPEHVPEFEVDRYYDYTSPIDFGGVSIRPIHAPGHTPGMTSLMFDVMRNGIAVTCAVDGGFGTNGMSKQELLAAGLPLQQQQDFIDSLTRLRDMKVDVVLPSHAAHAIGHPIFDIAAHDDGSGTGFVDAAVWPRMLDAKLAMLRDIQKMED